MENFETNINNFCLKSAKGKDKATYFIFQVLSTEWVPNSVLAGTETEYWLSVLSRTETGTVPTYKEMDCYALP